MSAAPRRLSSKSLSGGLGRPCQAASARPCCQSATKARPSSMAFASACGTVPSGAHAAPMATTAEATRQPLA
eukprot:5501618-Lingulodinium_polyedra.AAC.1